MAATAWGVRLAERASSGLGGLPETLQRLEHDALVVASDLDRIASSAGKAEVVVPFQRQLPLKANGLI